MEISTCPFCDVDIVSRCFAYENGYFALLNFAPILPGHTLIIPQKHIEKTFEFSTEELAVFFLFARKITQFLLHHFQGEGFDWSLQEGECAGQSVKHLHLHVIIRKAGDLPRPGDWYRRLRESKADLPLRPHLSDDELIKQAGKLRKALAEWKL